MKQCLMVFLMLFSFTAHAGISRWVDENNRVHYSDAPPPASAKAQKLRSSSDTAAPVGTSNTAATSAPAGPKTIAERDAELKKAKLAKKEADDKAAQELALKETNKTNCLSAQQNLKTLESGIRIPVFNANGESTYMEDEQRRQRTEKTREEVSKYCK